MSSKKICPPAYNHTCPPPSVGIRLQIQEKAAIFPSVFVVQPTPLIVLHVLSSWPFLAKQSGTLGFIHYHSEIINARN